MITNEEQLSAASQTLGAIQDEIRRIEKSSPCFDSFARIETESMRAFSKHIEDEISKYNLLRSGRWAAGHIENYEQLTKCLVEARIALGMTERELAEIISTSEDEIERYESQFYRGASVDLVKRASELFRVQVAESTWESAGSRSDASGEIDTAAVTSRHFREMFDRGWFGDFEGGYKEAVQYSDVLISHYTLLADCRNQPTHHRKSNSFDSCNELSLRAWEGRVFQKAEKIPLKAEFYQNVGNLEDWTSSLRELSSLDDGVRKAAHLLAEAGIALVYEPHLPQTYLDGMAAIHPLGFPLIAITGRYDRLDNFWFVLFHELGHLVLHLSVADKGKTFIDEIENTPSLDKFEIEADEFALNTLIPEDQWRSCMARFYQTEEVILRTAESLSVAPAIVAGRIRRESNDYTKFTDLLGQGSVRVQLDEA